MKIVNIAEKQSQKEAKTTIRNQPYCSDEHGNKESGLRRLKAVFRGGISFPVSHGIAKTELKILDFNHSSAALGSFLTVTTEMLLSLADN